MAASVRAPTRARSSRRASAGLPPLALAQPHCGTNARKVAVRVIDEELLKRESPDVGVRYLAAARLSGQLFSEVRAAERPCAKHQQ